MLCGDRTCGEAFIENSSRCALAGRQPREERAEAFIEYHSSRCRRRADQECEVWPREPGSVPCPVMAPAAERVARVRAGSSSEAAWTMTPAAEFRARRQASRTSARPSGDFTSPGHEDPLPSQARIGFGSSGCKCGGETTMVVRTGTSFPVQDVRCRARRSCPRLVAREACACRVCSRWATVRRN